MNTDLRSPRLAVHRPWPCERPQCADKVSLPQHDIASRIEFARMESAYAPHGGMLCSDEAVRQMRELWDQPISVLAKWIVARTMITIDWRHEMLIPMFQIDLCARSLRSGCAEITMELRDVMDDWEIARWFAACNPWLGGLPPVDMMVMSSREAFHAARVARFIARG
jgi:hypothetical protein